MKIVLTGGTGYIGSAVLDRLTTAGHEVTAIVRSDASRATVEQAGATGLVGDLFDSTWLREQLVQHDAAIHTAAGSDADDQALNTSVVEAAIAAFGGTTSPFVLTGGVWTYGSGTDLAEDAAANPVPLTAWRVPLERQLLASDVRASVIQPGIVYGHGAGIPAMIISQKSYPGTGDQHWTTVHVDDLAELYLAALDAPGGQAYLGVSGENPMVREIGGAIGPEVTAQGDEATLETLGAFGEALLLDQQASGAKARADLGWTPSRPTLVELLREGYSSDR
ncbi:NAD-dependent epimerase/dehydratase family protein [Aeromicrobium sp.]|uniref:NAD-dependent epimerase/dehydratase family protein n=1 Tax=Aeromicrobium sp. TaxID=1871063 RepID=UPI0025BCA1F4|nr:NAD-dependent epimerase/dehydratase family protein [Aeromicrobium sp.]MCK5891757.1 NAD-dependent epimerase/dehydratase family protein [Aeromicrobium sp.]